MHISEWPKLCFHIWPKPKAEDWKIFCFWPNTEAECWNSYPSTLLNFILTVNFWCNRMKSLMRPTYLLESEMTLLFRNLKKSFASQTQCHRGWNWKAKNKNVIFTNQCTAWSQQGGIEFWKSSRLPRKPLKCLENLSPSPSPVTGYGDNKGTPSFNVPFRPL